MSQKAPQHLKPEAYDLADLATLAIMATDASISILFRSSCLETCCLSRAPFKAVIALRGPACTFRLERPSPGQRTTCLERSSASNCSEMHSTIHANTYAVRSSGASVSIFSSHFVGVTRGCLTLACMSSASSWLVADTGMPIQCWLSDPPLFGN